MFVEFMRGVDDTQGERGNNRIGVVGYERKRIGCNSHTGNITMSRKDYFFDIE